MGNANMLILVYDVTNQDTFQFLRNWYEQILQGNEGKELSGIVVANKIDLENRAVIGAQDGMAFAQQIGFAFYEVSAQHNKGIDEAFKGLASMVRQRYEERIEQVREMV